MLHLELLTRELLAVEEPIFMPTFVPSKVFAPQRGASPRAGFTLVEILLVVAVVAILSGVAMVAVTNTRESTRVSKLESDVATINAAIQVYQVNGGALPAIATPQQILDKLKTSADTASAAAIPGLHGSVVDRRLWVDPNDPPTGAEPRALWNGTAGRFVIATSGSNGVRNFLLDDTKAATNYGTEARTPGVVTQTNGWVWNYVDVAPTARGGPAGGPGTTTGTSGTSPTSRSALQLNPPTFSRAGASQIPLTDFDISLTLANPNPAGSSQVFYSVNGGAFTLYGGQTLVVTPNTSISAYAATNDPDHWTDSASAPNTYTVDPVTLVLTLNFPQTSFTFQQAGGAMVGVPAVTPSPGTMTITNTAQIPPSYQSSTQFDIRWTLDGTNPLTAASPNVTGAFSGSVPTPSITINPDLWGTTSSVAVKAAAKAKTAWFLSSTPVQSATLAISPTTLTAPTFDSPSGTYFSGLPATINFASGALYPVNARIYYTTDGTDPGNVGGNPVSGAILYSGTFNVLTLASPTSTITARVYGPSTYPQWFTPSAAITSIYQLYFPPPWHGYIVGQFNTTVNTAFNGIEQLNDGGNVDLSFNPGTGTGTGNSNSVRGSVFQSDGKAILVGDFTTYNGTTMNRIVRVNADGSRDTTFNIGTGFNGETTIVVVQPDGKILVGGSFTTYNGVARRNIARLNSDGSLDTTFTPGTGTTGSNSLVDAIAVQGDGKILLGGAFAAYNGTLRNNLVRVNSDGTVDTTFTIGTGPNDRVYSVIVQSDGNIFIGGAFSSYNGTSKGHVARLTSAGAIDSTFTIGSGASSDVYTAALQSDGKFVIGGSFNSYNGTSRKAIARINANGTLDTGFDLGTGSGVGSYTVLTISIQDDGQIIFGGDFAAYNPGSRANLMRVSSAGVPDDTFAPVDMRPQATVYATALNGSDKLLIGGDFTANTSVGLNNVARLGPSDGTLDTSFNPGTGTDSNSLVWGLAEQSDGRILIGGDFTTVDSHARAGIARLDTDGSIDASFNPGSGATGGGVWTVAVQTDGKILIAGQFTSYNGSAAPGIARLTSGGARDTSFSAGAGFNGYVSSSVIQPDGKIIVGGGFTTYAGVAAKRIVRINTNGTIDSTVGNAVGVDQGQVNWVGLQPDGKIIFGGSFTTVGGVARGGIARLNADGTLDTTFASSSGINSGAAINSFALQSDGKIVIGGTFTTYAGVARPRIARVNRDGTLDTAFSPGQGPTAVAPLTPNVQSVIVQPDAKIIIAGSFSGYNGTAVNKIIRLNADGTYDSAFGSSTLSIKTINNTR